MHTQIRSGSTITINQEGGSIVDKLFVWIRFGLLAVAALLGSSVLGEDRSPHLALGILVFVAWWEMNEKFQDIHKHLADIELLLGQLQRTVAYPHDPDRAVDSGGGNQGSS